MPTNNDTERIPLNRPEPIISDTEVFLYDRRMEAGIAVEALFRGDMVLIIDFYSSGLDILSALKKSLESKYKDQSFTGQRDLRAAFREISHRLLLLVSHNKLTVKKAPFIGWLKILYPDLHEFLLPFPQVQGLNSAWQWYEKGITFPVLPHKIHPYFGTYFPTRFEHLKLFDHWLDHYKGEKQSAIDVGIGCGVLSFQLAKHGFREITGTDSNPNAIIGLKEALDKIKPAATIALRYGDLFANCTVSTELIVFNPPWLPASYDTDGIDKAVYYDADLFPRFFAEAEKHLTANGSLLLLFSNLAQITKMTSNHPIEKELAGGGRFKKELFVQKKVSQASASTKRNQNWRSSEMVELWVLKKLNPQN